MTDTRNVVLAGQTFAVPRLPLRITRSVYPLCQKLTANRFLDRVAEAGGTFACADDAEFGELIEVAFGLASAATPDLTRDAFDNLPVAPQELIDAFIAARFQTGAWIELPAGESSEAKEGQGEAMGAASPQ